MKAVLVVLSLAVAVAAAAPLLGAAEYHTLFNAWAKQHGKQYEAHEVAYRLGVFQKNMDFVIKRRAEGAKWSHTVAMNKFGDLTNDEFRAMYHSGFAAPEYAPFEHRGKHGLVGDAPASVDWVAEGKVTPVKNQGQCGSCWSFSTTGAVEGIMAITTGNLVSLSEQELVDCSTQNAGCSGGDMPTAMAWIAQNGGLCSEADYPYTAANGTCHESSCTSVSGSAIKGSTNVIANNETDLLYAVAQQPTSVAVDAGGEDWQFYSGGVLSDACGTDLDHGVLAAGYNTLNGQAYWLVKNSWGADWGANGYIYLARGSGTSSPGECGIAMYASYPTY